MKQATLAIRKRSLRTISVLQLSAAMLISVAGLVFLPAGCVDSIPLIDDGKVLVDIHISGPGTITAGNVGNYSIVAIYDDGSKETIANGIDWSIFSGQGSIDSSGVFRTSADDITADAKTIIHARYTEVGITREASYVINIVVDKNTQNNDDQNQNDNQQGDVNDNGSNQNNDSEDTNDGNIQNNDNQNQNDYQQGNVNDNGDSQNQNDDSGSTNNDDTQNISNNPPTAEAGDDQTVTDSDGNGSEQVTLDGSASVDSDGQIASYVWKEGDTQLATGVNSTISLDVGKHTITLIVTDDDGVSASDTVTITVEQQVIPNNPPTAEAGDDQTVTDSDGNGSEQVTLDGSASVDSDGQIASYVWKEGDTQLATGVNSTISLDVGKHTITLIVTDDDGVSASDTVTITVEQGQPAQQWQSPIGVPEPSFGINESYTMYRNATFDFGNGSEPYKDAGNGPYTHYVDNTNPNATDDGNPFGTPEVPRLTIPSELPAGSVVEVHGGPYTSDTSYMYWSAEGTADKPVFIRGVSDTNKPEIQFSVRIIGSYLIVENLTFKGIDINLHKDFYKHHISLRNNEMYGFSPSGFGQAINIRNADDVVIYNNEIHHNGDCESVEEDDVHGVAVVDNCKRIWIVDNNIHHNGGDAVQVNAYNTGDADAIQYVYIARNEMHDDRENAIDIKTSRDVIISQNTLYGYMPTTGEGSDGTAIVGGHEGSQRTWIIYNDISEASHAIRVNDSDYSPDVYIIGNVIHNIHHPAGSDYNPTSMYASGSAIITWYSSQMYVVNNTIYDTDAGFIAAGYGDGQYYLANNIIADLAEDQAYHIGIQSSSKAANSTVKYNLLYQNGEDIRIRWGGQYLYSIADFQSATGEGEGCIDVNPQFVNPDEGNFALQSTSGAINAGADDNVYQEFYNLYGLNIKYDINGDVRPAAGGFDIGAYEQ